MSILRDKRGPKLLALGWIHIISCDNQISDLCDNQVIYSLLFCLFLRYKCTIKLSPVSLYSSREATRIYKENGSQCRARKEHDPRTTGEHIFYKEW